MIFLGILKVEFHRSGHLKPRLRQGTLWVGIGSHRQQLRTTWNPVGVTPREERGRAGETLRSSAAAFERTGTPAPGWPGRCNVLNKAMWKECMHHRWNMADKWKQYTCVRVHFVGREGERTSLRESLENYSSRKDFCLKANGLLPNTPVIIGGHMNALGWLWQITENPNQNLKKKGFTISLGKI